MKQILPKCVLIALLAILSPRSGVAQFGFNSGPIPLCDTSTFTANVSGIGILINPNWSWGSYLASVAISITTNHPQTLVITLTSPQGTNLLLSAYNGNGGSNYTSTVFDYFSFTSITTGSAPFSGFWMPQGGPLSIFDGEWADGTWTITVIDTSCINGGGGPVGTWVPGYFNGGGAAGGVIGIGGTGPPPPPCFGSIPSNSVSVCQGDTVNILNYYTNLNPLLQYIIYQNGSIVNNPSVITVGGVYYVEGHENPPFGCIYTANYTVTVSPKPAFGPDQFLNSCASTYNLNALFNTTGFASSWTLNGLPVANPAAVTTSGTYTLIGGNLPGCKDTVEVTLVLDPAPSLGPDINLNYCTGSATNLTTLFVTGSFTTNWYLNGNPVANPSAVSGPGTYVLIASNSSGCADTAQVVLNALPVPSLGPNQNIMSCNAASYNLNSLYNTTGFTASWTFSGNAVANPAAVSTSGVYTLIVSNAANCSDTVDINLTVGIGPSLGSDQTINVCTGTSIDLTSLYSPGSYPSTWFFNGSTVANSTAVSAPGTYTLIATAANGCADTAQVFLNVIAVPALGPNQSIDLCSTDFLNLNTLYITTGYTTSWTVNGINVANPAAINSAGTYVLIATAAGNCADTAEVIVTVMPTPTLGTDVTVGLCAGNVADLTGYFNTTGLIANWTLNGLPVVNPNTVGISGTYTLIASNAICSDTANVNLTISSPALGPDLYFNLCPGNTINLSSVFNTAGSVVNYYFNGAALANYTAVYDSGTYLLIATDGNGCADSAVAVLENICPCIADFTTSGFCFQEPFSFDIIADSAITGAHWQFGSPTVPDQYLINPVVIFPPAESATVTLTLNLTCGTVIVQHDIELVDCALPCPVFLPGAFTPNEDGQNDQYKWFTECKPDQFELAIYNRYGQEIFKTDNPALGWDGSFDDKESPVGLYVVKINYQMPYHDEQSIIQRLWVLR